MMRSGVPFKDVLALLEEHGWTLQKVWEPYRVFTKGRELPILIPVHNKMVSAVYVQKIQAILNAEAEGDEAG